MQPFLLYSDPDGRRRLHALAGERVTIGRRPSCDVALPWDVEVSRLHAELVRLGQDWVLHDEGLSRNGTFVNGERVRGRRRLRMDDALTVGATVLSLCGTETNLGSTRAARPAGADVEVTPAQRRVLDALCRPLLHGEVRAPATNRAIADELSLSVETVKGTLSVLYEHFGLSPLAQNEKRAALAVRALSGSRCAPPRSRPRA
jgi:pSer/pThr/pTyr-binding forkhead associated (FHA) protein